MNQFDLVVLGGGPGGLAAAKAAATEGMRVALVNAGPLLGYGLEGAYKSKSMYEIAKTHHAVKHRWTLMSCENRLDFTSMRDANRVGAGGLRRVHRAELVRLGVQVIVGHGSFLDPHTLRVDGEDAGVLHAERFVVATGTAPRQLPGAQADGRRIITSDEIVDLDDLPESLLILGAGVIGCEFASIFASLGTQVTLIDSRERIFSHDDADLSALLSASLEDMGVTIYRNARCSSITPALTHVTTQLGASTPPIETSHALLAVGRIPNTHDIGLDVAGVSTDARGYITVSDFMESSQPHIYAVGDVGLRSTPHDLALVHIAEAEGRAAVQHMMHGAEAPLVHTEHVPFIIFTLPMISGAGLNETEARALYGDVRVGKYAHVRNHRAHAMRCMDGFVKLVVGPEGDDRVLGARAIGAGADSIVGEVAILVRHGLPYTHLIDTIYAHPSISESVQGAARIIGGCASEYLEGEEFVELQNPSV